MATAAENIATIEGTLAQLYAKLHKTMTQKDRSATLQDIAILEHSRDYWAKELKATNGTRPRCASVDMSGFTS